MSAFIRQLSSRISEARTLPVIQQTELSECGIACLAMVSRFYGHDLDISSLRRRYPVSLRGATLREIMEAAEDLLFEARPIRVELSQLMNLKTPCILHWDFNHFVVLKRATAKVLEIHDPARGAVRVSISDASAHFTGVALELRPAPSFEEVKDRRRISLRALTGKIYGWRRAAFLVLLLGLILESFTLVLPLSMQWVIDHVLVSQSWELLHLIGIGFLVVVVFQSLTFALRGYVVANISGLMKAQWVTNLFSHMTRLPVAYFERRQVGGIMSRFTSINAIQRTLSASFVEAILDGLAVCLAFILLLIYSKSLTFIVVGAFLIYLAIRWLTYKRLHTLNEEQLVHVARRDSSIIETMRGIQAIKLSGVGGQRRQRVENQMVEVSNREVRIQRLNSIFGALSRLVFGSQRLILIWMGASYVLSGSLTVGMLVVILAYSEVFSGRGSIFIDRLVDLKMLGLHAERIADLALEAPEANVESRFSGTLQNKNLDIEGVSFKYTKNGPWVLRDCSMHIAAGESVAIKGLSGSGKTTFVKILLGLLEPDQGSVKIGQVDIQNFGLKAYRRLFGVVMQDDQLLEGSLAENISFFDPESSIDKIEVAAKAASIHEDISIMPMGYDTLVGDMGSSLSGGQKQRVLLARALYANPEILVLDEATSHLDLIREAEINKRVANLGVTRIIIAHRPETLESADLVVEIRDGRIIQSSAESMQYGSKERPAIC